MPPLRHFWIARSVMLKWLMIFDLPRRSIAAACGCLLSMTARWHANFFRSTPLTNKFRYATYPPSPAGCWAPHLPAITADRELTVDQESSDWIEWAGGECPVTRDTRVEVKYRDGLTNEGPGGSWLAGELADHGDWWKHEGSLFSGHDCDIIAYRVVRA